MRKFRRKPHAVRRHREQTAKHWLNEGVAGEESLLLELDPYLFGCDQYLSTLSSSISHSNSIKGESLFAMLVPPVGSVGWQVGYLSKKFNVYIWAPDDYEFIVEAADRFGAKLVSGALENAELQPIELFLFTNTRWGSQEEFVQTAQESRSYLSPEGLMCAVLPAEGADQAEYILWGDGKQLPLDSLLGGELFPLGAPRDITTISLSQLNPFEGATFNSFHKRNKEFFGKNLRELGPLRMQDPEFLAIVQNPRSWVACALWGPVGDR